MIEINNLTNVLIDKRFFKKVAQIILKEEGKEINLSIAFIKKKEIRILNKRYKKEDKETDVLSFGEATEFEKIDNLKVQEIVICPSVVFKNAKKYKLIFKKELTKVLIHGILHLFHYDHEQGGNRKKKMEKKEDYYVSKNFL